MRFIERVTGLLIRPNETMKDIVRRPRILEAFAIVFTYALLGVISTIVQMSKTTLIINDATIIGPNLPVNMKLFIIISYTAQTFIFAITLWPITAGVLHIISKIFGGSGRFIPDIMTAIGYTYLIKIPALLIAIILLILAPPLTMMSTSFPAFNPNSTATVYPAAANSTAHPLAATSTATTYSSSISYKIIGGNSMLTVISNLVSMAGVILSSLLGILAIKHAEGLRTRDATIIVGVPLLFYLVYALISLLSYYLLNVVAGV